MQELTGLRGMLRMSEPDLAAREAELEKVERDLDAGILSPGESLEDLQSQARMLRQQIDPAEKRVKATRQRANELESLVAGAEADRAEWKRFLDQEIARESRRP